MSDELNVWRRAREGYNSQTNPYPTTGMDAAAAAIRDYGDQRHAAGYQAAIADVVEWLREAFTTPTAEHYANRITRRFGKGQDHG